MLFVALKAEFGSLFITIISLIKHEQYYLLLCHNAA